MPLPPLLCTAIFWTVLGGEPGELVLPTSEMPLPPIPRMVPFVTVILFTWGPFTPLPAPVGEQVMEPELPPPDRPHTVGPNIAKPLRSSVTLFDVITIASVL